jgi:hypothetical protein
MWWPVLLPSQVRWHPFLLQWPRPLLQLQGRRRRGLCPGRCWLRLCQCCGRPLHRLSGHRRLCLPVSVRCGGNDRRGTPGSAAHPAAVTSTGATDGGRAGRGHHPRADSRLNDLVIDGANLGQVSPSNRRRVITVDVGCSGRRSGRKYSLSVGRSGRAGFQAMCSGERLFSRLRRAITGH